MSRSSVITGLYIMLTTLVCTACDRQLSNSIQSPQYNFKDITVVKAGVNDTLIPVRFRDRWGYINTKGDVVIGPGFYSAGDFNNGLAAVRADGLYGYINKFGAFVIQPSYDFAGPFSEGRAIVWVNGQERVIDEKGAVVFVPKGYKLSSQFKNGFAEVVTGTHSRGLINKEGKLVLDTIYSNISEFKNGIAQVCLTKRLGPDRYSERQYWGLLDTNGHWIIKPEKFSSISEFSEGLASATYYCEDDSELKEEDDDDEEEEELCIGYIDRRGILIIQLPKNRFHEPGDFHDGLALVSVKKADLGKDQDEETYPGYIDKQGKLLFSFPDADHGHDFKNGHTLVGDYGNYQFINRSGTTISHPGIRILKEGSDLLKRSWLAETGDYSCIIDSMGRYIINPVYHDITPVGGESEVLICTNDKECVLRYSNGKNVTDLTFTNISPAGSAEGSFYFSRNGANGVYKVGKGIIWSDSAWSIGKNDSPVVLTSLNVDFMLRGYYMAYSRGIRSGGWASSANLPLKIKTTSEFPRQSVTLKVWQDKPEPFMKNYSGWRVTLSNTTNDTLLLSAQDSRLYMNMQAKQEDGSWKDIEYLPSSWCGNSYHSVFLRSGEYWQFVAPAYQGSYKTKLRLKLQVNRKKEKNETDYIYSNEFEGSINPAQFWRKQGYSPNGIMDPYLD